jgi:hypothetical protein
MPERNFDKNLQNVRNIAHAVKDEIALKQQEALDDSLRIKTERLLRQGRSITEISYRTDNALKRIVSHTLKSHQYTIYKIIEETLEEILPPVINQTFEEFADFSKVYRGDNYAEILRSERRPRIL